ncbi:Ig-like domain repeat protein [Streptomyces lavendulae]|uniref:Ig-like domain repeat protein n=1 Tax=Streptomyces lavendulae TaxID=1914 RepID=UPI0036A26AD0
MRTLRRAVRVVLPVMALSVAGVIVPAAPAAAFPAGTQSFVVSGGSFDLTGIDATANTVTGTTHIGLRTVAVAAHPNGSRLYTANDGNDSVTVVNAVSGAIITDFPLSATGNPVDIAISPDGTRGYTANFGVFGPPQNSSSVSVFDTATNMQTAAIFTGRGTRGIVVSPDGTRAYTANSQDGNVSVINTATNTVINTIPVLGGGTPAQLAVTPDGSRLYVANDNNNTVTVINPVAGTVVTTIPVGNNPLGVAITPNGAQVYVANAVGGTVSVISTTTNTVVNTITVGTAPVDVAISPDGSLAHVANSGSGSVSVINVASGTVTGSVPVASPDGVTFANVPQRGSATTVTSSLNKTVLGDSVTFTATVTGTGPTPTGTVTFKDGATVLGNDTLDSNGQATFTTSALAVGTHPITAEYGGDATFTTSTSPVLSQFVIQCNCTATSTTALVSSANPSTPGQSVTFTATVTGTPASPGPTGMVTFRDGATVLGTDTLDGNGQATFTTSALSAGSHPITAQYGGDLNYPGSISNTVQQVVATPTVVTAACPVGTVITGGGFDIAGPTPPYLTSRPVNNTWEVSFINATGQTVEVTPYAVCADNTP